MTKTMRKLKLPSLLIVFSLLTGSCSNQDTDEDTLQASSETAGRPFSTCAELTKFDFALCLMETDRLLESQIILVYLAQRGDSRAQEFLENYVPGEDGNIISDERLGLSSNESN